MSWGQQPASPGSWNEKPHPGDGEFGTLLFQHWKPRKRTRGTASGSRLVREGWVGSRSGESGRAVMPRHRWRVRRAGRTRCRRAHWRSAHRVQELARPARGAAVVFGCSGAGRLPAHDCDGGHQRRPGSAGVGRTPGAAGGRGAWHRLQRRGGPAVAAGAVGALGDHGGGSARSAGTQRPAPASAGQGGLVRPGAGGQFAGSGGGPGCRLTPDRGAGACLSRRPDPSHGGPGTGAGASRVSDFLCAGLFAVRYRMFIRCPLFALSDAFVPGLSSGLAESDLPLLPRADAACPGFRGVCCCPGRPLPDPLRIAWRAAPVCH